MSPLATASTITVIDFETTGHVSDYPSEPWQIGMVQLYNGKVDPSTCYESNLRIGSRPFNPHAPGKHHLIREELLEAPTFHEVLPQINNTWLFNIPLCAHNIGTEKTILKQAAPLHHFGPWIDTLKLARIAWPRAKSHKLEELSVDLGIYTRAKEIMPNGEPHDALFDALCSALLLELLLETPSWSSATIETLSDPAT